MHSNLVAGTALAGSLLISTFMWGAAQAASAPDLKGALGNSSAITLVGHGGGHMGGGGGGMSGGGTWRQRPHHERWRCRPGCSRRRREPLHEWRHRSLQEHER